jgi:PAS domain S-box-containing protein
MTSSNLAANRVGEVVVSENPDTLVSAAIRSVFDQLRSAEGRVAALHSRYGHEDLDHGYFELFQELDTAHEELRVAEEHIHAQADALAFAQSAIATEGRRYRELFEAAPEAYLLTDLHGNIREANRRAASLLNVPSISLPGKPLRLFVAAEDQSELVKALELLREEPAACFELRFRPRGGVVPFWTAVSVCSAYGMDGQPVSLRWLIRDTSGWKLALRRQAERNIALEDELRERTRELEATRYLLEQSMLSRTGNVELVAPGSRSHLARARQMRIVLSRLSNWLKVLRIDKLEPAVRKRAIDSMSRAVDTLTRSLDDVLDSSERD